MSRRGAICVQAGILLGWALGSAGCGPSTNSAARAAVIANAGSDTMLQLGMAWSEAYRQAAPTVSVEVSGGGSGVGIAGLINGSVDLASASRALEDHERQELLSSQGKEAREFVVGFDALSIYVHRDNPLEEISLEQLGEIWRRDGNIRQWSDLGVTNLPGAKGDQIIVVSRQNNSGTHHYFREAAIGKYAKERADKINQNGSADVVNLIGATPNAIGYSGMGYKTDRVKSLRVSRAPGDDAVGPSLQSTRDHTYPISRPMFLYTAGDPTPILHAYLDWVLSPAGQAIVQEQGYVPAKPL
jgi:phosphate transport system substrate-binding protein